MLNRIRKQLGRFKRKLLGSEGQHREEQRLRYKQGNQPYEESTSGVKRPVIRDLHETLHKLVQNRASFARFGDGEFGLMSGGRIHFQDRSSNLAGRLKEVIDSNLPDLLIGLPDCFGPLEAYTPPVIEFWREWMGKKRSMAYEFLDMDRVYYSAFVTRVYMPFKKTDEHFLKCGRTFETIRQLWKDRDVLICEGEGTRFGMFNDLLDGARSVSRILCPARNAYDRYDGILAAFDQVPKDRLVLAALGPTATVLVHDLSRKRFQAIDIGHLDVEYEWFLKKATEVTPLDFKYVGESREGREVRDLEDKTYRSQIIQTVL